MKLVERLVEWCEAKDHAGVMGESNRLLSALIRHSKSKVSCACGFLYVMYFYTTFLQISLNTKAVYIGRLFKNPFFPNQGFKNYCSMSNSQNLNFFRCFPFNMWSLYWLHSYTLRAFTIHQRITPWPILTLPAFLHKLCQ